MPWLAALIMGASATLVESRPIGRDDLISDRRRSGADRGRCSLQPMDFGFTLKPDHSVERSIALTRQAEAAGFSYGWLFDSHVAFREAYPLLTLMAANTSTMRLGTCVTNPATREPSVTASAIATLNEISGGRMDPGIGRGDSSVRAVGRPPTTLKSLEQAVTVIRDLVEGRTTSDQGGELSLSWTGR